MPTGANLEHILRNILGSWLDDQDTLNAVMAILKSSRPAGWCFGPILYGIGVLNSRIWPRSPLAFFISALQVFSLSLPLCIVVFGINDVYDYQTDLVNPRKVSDGLEGTVLLPRYHDHVRHVAYLSSTFIIATALLSRQRKVLFVTVLLVLLGWQYSAPPLRLKEVPLADSVSNGMIVFLAWLIGYHSNGVPRSNASKGYLLGICTAGVHALGAVVDVTSDIAAGQRTIATAFGPHLATIFSIFSFLVALFIEGFRSVFGVYLAGGAFSTSIALLRPEWAHAIFQVVVYWTLGMSVVWFGTKIACNSGR